MENNQRLSIPRLGWKKPAILKEVFWLAYYLFLSSLFLPEMLYTWRSKVKPRPWGESGVCTLPDRSWVKLPKLEPTPRSASLLWPQTTPLTPPGINKGPEDVIWSSSKLWCRWPCGRIVNRRIAKSRTSAVIFRVVIHIDHNLLQWTQDPNKLIIFKLGSLQVCHIFEPGISLWGKTIFSAMMQKPF